MPNTLQVHFSSQTVEWATPPELFADLDAEFSFEIDVCATVENAKCPTFFTIEDDGLKEQWTGVCWMNPPYGRVIGDWVRKAFESAQQGATVVCLVPARTDTKWWNRYCVHGEIRFIEGRLKFGDGRGTAPFPSAIIVFRPPTKSRFRWTTMMTVGRLRYVQPSTGEPTIPARTVEIEETL